MKMISAMGRKCVLLCLAMCLVFSSFHEVSCQVEGSIDFKTFDDQEFQPNYFNNLEEEEEEEGQSISESQSSWEQNTTVTDKKKISTSLSDETESEAIRDHEVGRSSSMMDDINREIEAHLGDLNTQAGSEGESKDAVEIGAFDSDTKKRKQLEEIERQLEAVAASKFVVEEGKEETHEIKIEATSTGSHQQSSTYNYLKEGNGGSRILGSLGILQSSGMWRCSTKIKMGSESKTSSLIASLTQIVKSYTKDIWSRSVITETSSKKSSETVEKLTATLKNYRNIKVHELFTRFDFEEILMMAARYEELSSASVSHISRLSMYKSVIEDGIKASQRVQLVQARAKLLNDMAMEKRKNVDAEFALVKALAQRGDTLYVKIFAIKKLVLKLEAEKEEVDMNFQRIIGNLSRVLEETSQAYEEYQVAERKYKEEKAAAEFSREAIESAEVVWVKFLSTL